MKEDDFLNLPNQSENLKNFLEFSVQQHIQTVKSGVINQTKYTLENRLRVIETALNYREFFNEFLNTYALLGALLIVLSGIVSIPGQIRQVNEK